MSLHANNTKTLDISLELKLFKAWFSAVMSETEIWQSRQDRDFQNHNPFYETEIETLKNPIPFSRLGSRLSICQSLFRDRDRDSQNVNPFFETGIETDKLEGITGIETGIETFN